MVGQGGKVARMGPVARAGLAEPVALVVEAARMARREEREANPRT